MAKTKKQTYGEKIGEKIDEMVSTWKEMKDKGPSVLTDGSSFDWAEAYETELKLNMWALEQALQQIDALNRKGGK